MSAIRDASQSRSQRDWLAISARTARQAALGPTLTGRPATLTTIYPTSDSRPT